MSLVKPFFISEWMKRYDNLLYALGQFSEYAKEFLLNKKKMLQLDLSERGSKILSKLISRIIIFIFVIFLILFGSLTLSIGLSMHFDSYLAGFGIVTALYLVLIIVVYFFRRILITNPIVNMIIKDIEH